MDEITRTYSGKNAEKWKRNSSHNLSDLIGKSYLIKRLNAIARDKTILDLGCGEGYLSRKISKKAKRVVGIDLSPEMIKLAKEQPGSVEYHCLDIKDVNKLDIKFDLVMISLVLHYFKSYELKSIAKKIAKLLKPGGKVFLLEINPYSVANHKSSKWLKHKKINPKKDSYINLQAYTLNAGYKKVGFRFYGLQYYINSFISAGCNLQEIIDLNAPPDVVKRYPLLSKENHLFFLMVFKKA